MRGSSGKNVVMVADDDLFVRKVLRTALQELAEIVEVTDGADVQKVYMEHMPDMLFLDIHLPHMSGMDLICPLLKADAGAYIVMLSADSSKENVRDSYYRGSRGFLTKPFKKERIVGVFNKCPTVRFMDASGQRV